jgi:cell division septum initiation protein DivIVA
MLCINYKNHDVVNQLADIIIDSIEQFIKQNKSNLLENNQIDKVNFFNSIVRKFKLCFPI